MERTNLKVFIVLYYADGTIVGGDCDTIGFNHKYNNSRRFYYGSNPKLKNAIKYLQNYYGYHYININHSYPPTHFKLVDKTTKKEITELIKIYDNIFDFDNYYSYLAPNSKLYNQLKNK